MVIYGCLPSGKRLQFANWKITIEIVYLPSYKIEIFNSYVTDMLV